MHSVKAKLSFFGVLFFVAAGCSSVPTMQESRQADPQLYDSLAGVWCVVNTREAGLLKHMVKRKPAAEGDWLLTFNKSGSFSDSHHVLTTNRDSIWYIQTKGEIEIRYEESSILSLYIPIDRKWIFKLKPQPTGVALFILPYSTFINKEAVSPPGDSSLTLTLRRPGPGGPCPIN